MMELLRVGYRALLENLSSVHDISSVGGASQAAGSWEGGGMFGGVGTQSGESISPTTAQEVPAFFACIKVISEDVGKLPLIPYRRLGVEEKELMVSGAITRVLLKRVSPSVSPLTFKELITSWALAWGNGYAEIVRNSRGEPTDMWPIHPSRVQIHRDTSGEVWYQVRFQNGTDVTIPANDMLHIRGPGDELYGWNLPVSVAKETLGSARAQIIFAASFFGNSSVPAGILTHPATLKGDAKRHLRESMQKFYGGSRNAAKLLVLDEGMGYQAMSMPLKQAQFLESRNFSVEEIARYFRMPLHKIQSMKQSTNNNIEQQALEYTQDTLMPWLVRWEQEIDLKFWPDTEDFFSKFNVDEMLRGDFDSRTEGYSRMFSIGALSINEIRAKEDMNPVEGGDTRFVPLNMVPLQQALEAPKELAEGRDNRRKLVEETFKPVIHSSTMRLVNKETKALGRANTKSLDECLGTMTKFYERHETDMVESTLPHLTAYLSLTGDDMAVDAIRAELSAICSTFCAQAMSKIESALDGTGPHIQAVLNEFKLDRAQDMTDAIVLIGLVRSENDVKLN
jgi:HK97 family phage portal protein